jgi:putative spermidine/putrescine transport system ATP-binding protein
MADLTLTGLTKSFGTGFAVDRVELAVADGEALVLLGPSGCGKTTVMRMIAGIVEPDAGTISIGGRDVTGLAPERRNVGLVFQSYALFPHMTVAGNVGFGLRMRRVRADAARERVARALDLVELSALAKRYPRQLSGGQQQRVALARALVTEPDVLLLDEPLSNLDALLREQLREDLRALQRRLAVTMLYVTHDQKEAMALADRVVVMSEGRIREIGRPVDLYRRPRERFTAEFLGQTNIVAVAARGGHLTTAWGALLAAETPVRDGPALVSIRPEDIAIVPDTDGPGEIRHVAFLGAEVEYHVALPGAALRVRRSGSLADLLGEGTRVAVAMPPQVHALGDPP